MLEKLDLSESNYNCTLTELMCLMLEFKVAASEYSKTIEMKAVYLAFYFALSVPMH